MKKVQMIVRLLFILLWVILTVWSYVDGDILRAIFWLIITKVDMDGFEKQFNLKSKEVNINRYRTVFE